MPADLVTVGASASLTYDTSHGGYHGDRAIKITTGGSAVNCFARWQAMWRPTAGAAMVATIWVYFTANPPATTSLLQIADASVLRILEIRVTAAGRVRLMNAAGTTLADTTNLIALNQWIRIDVLFTPHASAGQAQLKLYNNPSSSTPTETTTNFTSCELADHSA